MQPNSRANTPYLCLIVGGASVRESRPAPPVTDADFSIEEVEITDDGVELVLFDRDGTNAVLIVIGNDELRERYAKALAKRQIIGGPPDGAA